MQTNGGSPRAATPQSPANLETRGADPKQVHANKHTYGVHVCVYIYIYIYIERERMDTYIYIYI